MYKNIKFPQNFYEDINRIKIAAKLEELFPAKTIYEINEMTQLVIDDKLKVLELL